MKTHATFFALFLAFVCVVQPAAAQSATCESHDGRYRECRLPFSGTAQIERQLSSTSCEYGRTWGQRSSGRVWVSDGCRARFVPAGDWGQGSASGALLRCESSGGRRVCRSGAAGRMTIQRQLSKTTCVEGRNWGSYGNGEVWVDGGCRAEFAPAAGWQGGQYGSHYGSDGALLRCESSGRRQVCRSGVQGQLTLHRQLSKTTCVEGRNWGSYGNGEVWVDGGCRAEFVPAYGGSSGWQQSRGHSVHCSSHDSAPSYCEWHSRWGSPRLLRQHSSAACEQGRTWGYTRGRGLWVSGGCRGEFGN